MKVRLRRGALVGAGVAVIASAVVFASLASAAPAKHYRIAILGYNSSPFGIATKIGAQTEAKALGSTADWFNANNDPHAQQTQMQDAISTGKYQAMWVYALDGVGLAPTIKQAEEKGIKVAVADYTLGTLNDTKILKPTPGLVSTVGSSLNEQINGFITAIKQACTAKVGAGKPCSVAFMYGLPNYPTDAYRVGVMKKAFTGTSIKLLIMPPGLYDQATSQKVTLDFFQKKPHVDVFATFGDQMNAGGDVALKQLGIKPGKDLYEVGFGATKQAIAWIKQGLWYNAATYFPTSEAKLGVKALIDALNGKKVPNVINILHLPGFPLFVDKAYLKAHPNFKGDWSL